MRGQQEVDVTVLDAAIEAAKDVFGKSGKVALDERRLKELEEDEDEDEDDDDDEDD